MSEVEKAWLAGIMDGEGTIYAQAHTRKSDGYNVILTGIKVGMQSFITIRTICDITETGKVYCQNTSGKKPFYYWQLSSQKAGLVLREILPYMITKRNQAKLFLALLEMMRQTGANKAQSPNGQWARDEQAFMQKRELAEKLRVLRRNVA